MKAYQALVISWPHFNRIQQLIVQQMLEYDVYKATEQTAGSKNILSLQKWLKFDDSTYKQFQNDLLDTIKIIRKVTGLNLW